MKPLIHTDTHRWISPLMVWRVSIFSVALYGLVVAYCYQNESGHSGIDWSQTVFFFGTLFFVAGYVLLCRAAIIPAILTLVVSLVGIFLSQLLKPLGIMQTHGQWVNGGMLSPTFDRTLFIAMALMIPIVLSSVCVGVYRWFRIYRCEEMH